MTDVRARSAVGPGSHSHHRRARSAFAATDIGDTDGYSRAVAGVSIEAIRAGATVGPGTVYTSQSEHFTSSSCRIGFPMLTRTNVAADHLLLALIESVPAAGSRWCEIELRPGSLIAYAPEAEHAAINHPGLTFTFAITQIETLSLIAAELGLTPTYPKRGEVHEVRRSRATAEVVSAFAILREFNRRQPKTQGNVSDEVVSAICRALTEEQRPHMIGVGRRIDSRQLVRAGIEYAEDLGTIPSNAELCMATHVSERRLRQAFVDEFDLPPTQFFRLWALQKAHDSLAGSSPQNTSVTAVAAQLGFFHLGRFAGHYKRVYGQSPSLTLRTSA